MAKYLAYCVFGDNDLGLAMHDETCLLMGQNRKTKLKRKSKKTEKLTKKNKRKTIGGEEKKQKTRAVYGYKVVNMSLLG